MVKKHGPAPYRHRPVSDRGLFSRNYFLAFVSFFFGAAAFFPIALAGDAIFLAGALAITGLSTFFLLRLWLSPARP